MVLHIFLCAEPACVDCTIQSLLAIASLTADCACCNQQGQPVLVEVQQLRQQLQMQQDECVLLMRKLQELATEHQTLQRQHAEHIAASGSIASLQQQLAQHALVVQELQSANQ
jgi:predicted RNase H-like nuclease (RuvC/YqgF family)